MKQACLLSGVPGAGKTTLIKQAINKVKGKAGGFYTREIRIQGERQGFEIITLDGQRGTLAHVNINSSFQVNKYGVDTDTMDRVGVTAIRRAIQECHTVVIDEIGKMELFSPNFRESVLEAFDSGKRILGTIMLSSHPWADKIKKDTRVDVLQVSRTNRQQILNDIITWLEDKTE